MDRSNKPEQFLVLTDAWMFMKKYLSADEDSVEGVIHDADEFYKEFRSEFAFEVAKACLNEIDRIIRKREEQNEEKYR